MSTLPIREETNYIYNKYKTLDISEQNNLKEDNLDVGRNIQKLYNKYKDYKRNFFEKELCKVDTEAIYIMEVNKLWKRCIEIHTTVAISEWENWYEQRLIRTEKDYKNYLDVIMRVVKHLAWCKLKKL